MKLTREQQFALLSDRPIAVVANAGSGKTRVLVERYFALLMRYGVQAIRSVVAITFTRAAAAEMFTRVAQRLESMLADPAYQEQWQRLKAIRERLSAARISTIHSFAAQVLRDYAVEAQLPPTFVEMTEYESQQLKYEILDQHIEEVLRDAQHRFHQALWDLFTTYRRPVAQQLLQSLIASTERFMEWFAVFQRPVEELLQRRNIAFQQQVEQLFQQYRQVIDRVLAVAEWEEKAFPIVAQLREWLAQAPELLSDYDLEAQQRFLKEWIAVHHRLFRTDGGIRKRLSSTPIPQRYIAALKRIRQRCQTLLDSLAFAALDRPMFTQLQAIMLFLQEVVQHTVERKRKEGRLDFDDLQLLLLEVLDQHPQAVEELKRQIRYIMVDEFQDTNKVQYALIRKLTVLEDAHRGANLFVVGDPKQSIYGFRGSDVRVFRQVQQDIRTFNRKQWGESPPEFVEVEDRTVTGVSRDEWLGNIELRSSFRMLPRLAAFVNTVCDRVMAQSWSAYDVEYAPLVVARSPVDQGSITFVTAVQRKQSAGEQSQEQREEEAEAMLSEAELVASFIRNAVEGSEPLECGEFQGFGLPEQRRKVRYADIAVLFRSRREMATLAAAFRQYRVPFFIYAGTGFYQQPEIQDIRAFLLFLHNPHDDIALAAVLRSPFFAIEDAELAAIAAQSGNSFWEKLQRGMQHAPAEFSPALLAAYRQLQALVAIAPRMTIPALVRMILEQTGWYGKIAADLRREQMAANMEKLIAFAREYQRRGFVSLYDFAQELLERARFEQHEGEAEQLAGKDAVRMMTIHAAKGQEFPVVVLYNLNSIGRQQNSTAFLPHAQFGGAIPPVQQEEPPRMVTTPAVVLARMEQEAKEWAELKRLLYVALTRAQDHLVLSSTVWLTQQGNIQQPKGMLSLILEGLDMEPVQLVEAGQRYCEAVLGMLRDAEKVEWTTLRFPIALRTAVAETAPATAESAEGFQLPEVRLVNPPVEMKQQFLSASQLTYLAKAPEAFVQQYLLGLPVEKGRMGVFPQPEDERDSEYGAVQGEIFHYAMEQLPLWYSETALDSQRLQWVLRYAAQRIARFVPEALLQEVQKMVENVVATSLFQRYRSRLLKAEMEKTLWIPYQQDILFGRIDCVVQNETGMYEIWDWKTVAITEPAQMETFLEHYSPQLLVYLYLLAHWKTAQQHFVARLLFPQLARPGGEDRSWTIALRMERAQLLRPELLSQWYQQYQQYIRGMY